MSNMLVTTENVNAVELFGKDGKLDGILNKIEADARSVVADVKTAKGRKVLISVAAEVARSKTYLDGLGKELVSDWKAKSKAVDADRRAMRERLDVLKEEVRRPVTEWEKAENERVQAITERIAEFLVEPEGDSYSISLYISELEETVIDESFGEFAANAAINRDAGIARARAALEGALRAEKEEADRIAAEEQARKEHEERIAREAAEKARRAAEEAAERARKEAEAKVLREKAEASRRAEEAAQKAEQERLLVAQKAEQDRLRAHTEREAAEQRLIAQREEARRREEEAKRRLAEEKAAKEAAIKEAKKQELARIEKEKARQKEEAKRRQEDEERRRTVHAAILADLMDAVEKITVGKAVLDALISGKVRHVRVEY